MLEPTLALLEHSALIRRPLWGKLEQPLPEPEYVFKHALVQEIMYQSLLKHDRRRLHRLVAESLELADSERLDQVASLLALHWHEAGDAPRAFAYYLRAGIGVAKRIRPWHCRRERIVYRQIPGGIGPRRRSPSAQPED